MTYDYNASALGLGGVLKNADGTITGVPSLASVHLAPSGGEGFAEISNYNKDGVSFTTARSSVVGSDSGYRTFTTRSDVYITNLNLFGRVQAAILQMNISSTRDVFDEDPMAIKADPDGARFAMNAMIRGLVIDGVEVIPELDLALTTCPTYQQLTNTIGGAGTSHYAAQFGVEPEDLVDVLAANVQPIRTSFVRTLQYLPTSQFGPRSGFKLPVKNFGTVHFGEMVVKPGHRHANLLRIELDSTLSFWDNNEDPSFTTSPFGGSMTIANNVGNGSPSWP